MRNNDDRYYRVEARSTNAWLSWSRFPVHSANHCTRLFHDVLDKATWAFPRQLYYVTDWRNSLQVIGDCISIYWFPFSDTVLGAAIGHGIHIVLSINCVCKLHVMKAVTPHSTRHHKNGRPAFSKAHGEVVFYHLHLSWGYNQAISSSISQAQLFRRNNSVRGTAERLARYASILHFRMLCAWCTGFNSKDSTYDRVCVKFPSGIYDCNSSYAARCLDSSHL